jgi:hypothetical protein
MISKRWSSVLLAAAILLLVMPVSSQTLGDIMAGASPGPVAPGLAVMAGVLHRSDGNRDPDAPVAIRPDTISVTRYARASAMGPSMTYTAGGTTITTRLLLPHPVKWSWDSAGLASNQLRYSSQEMEVTYELTESSFKDFLMVDHESSLPIGYAFTLSGSAGDLRVNHDGSLAVMDTLQRERIAILPPYAVDADGVRYDMFYQVVDDRILFLGLDHLAGAQYHRSDVYRKDRDRDRSTAGVSQGTEDSPHPGWPALGHLEVPWRCR